MDLSERREGAGRVKFPDTMPSLCVGDLARHAVLGWVLVLAQDPEKKMVHLLYIKDCVSFWELYDRESTWVVMICRDGVP